MKNILAVGLLSLAAIGCSQTKTVNTSTEFKDDDGVMTCMALNCVKDDSAHTDHQFKQLMSDVSSNNMGLLVDGRDIVLQSHIDVFFDESGKILLGDVMEKVDPIIAFIKDKDVKVITITAHTSKGESKEKEYSVTKSRAESVEAIFEVLDIDPDKVYSFGLGSDELEECGISKSTCNERIDIRLIDVF